jgi:hypothetical protein
VAIAALFTFWATYIVFGQNGLFRQSHKVLQNAAAKYKEKPAALSPSQRVSL